MNESPFFDDREHLFENSIGFVIFDNFPVSEGHSLIIPKRVYSSYFDSTEEELKGFNELIFETKDYLDKKFKPQGYNIGVNCGSVSGQTIDHVHIHLIPRYLNDVKDPRGGVRGVIPSKKNTMTKKKTSTYNSTPLQ
jgi:diadenosine tetraphosphate (Ap4A) HIT family hydrolase